MTLMGKKNNVGKSESLTIRLDPKTRFALEFVARINGQTITSVMEKSIKSIAETTYADPSQTYIYNDQQINTSTWKRYWDINEGVRFIKLVRDVRTNPSYDEEEILDFIKIHWNYFSENQELTVLRRDCIDVIWPHIHEIMHMWRETKTTDRTQASLYIQEKLRVAGLLTSSVSQKTTNLRCNKKNKPTSSLNTPPLTLVKD